MNILISGALQDAEKNIVQFEAMGHSVVFVKNEWDKLPCDYSWVEGVICNGLFLHHEIESFCNLKYIQLTSAGYDRVPMEYIKNNNITIFNAKDVYSIPMAEYALCGVLQLYKKSEFFYKNQKNREWIKNRDIMELFKKTVCIVGCGSVGKECAKRFKAFGMWTKGVDIVKPDSDYIDEYIEITNIKDALERADIVVLTLPCSKETLHMFNKDLFSYFKKGAIIVNISRGQIIRQADLIEALEENKLSGAVIDVFEEEPLGKESRLWDMENVIVTPHNSFVGDGVVERLYNCIYNNLKNYKKEALV